MKVSELIEVLNEIPPDTEILIGTRHGTLIRLGQAGTIHVIPARINPFLIPGSEWRMPVNDKDEPAIERELAFVVI